MRYLSDYGKNKVFDTERECLEYENNERKRLQEEKIIREKMEKERCEKLSQINKKYQELEKLISEFGEKYGTKEPIYFSPIYDLIRALCG